MEFKNPKVAQKFSTDVEKDIKINRSDFHGMLSDIDETVAEAMVKAGSQYVKVKAETKAKPEVKPS